MRLVFDSSAFLKRYFKETGTEELLLLCESASELVLSVLVVSEIVSGLNRKIREGLLTPQQYRATKRRLMEDAQDATLIEVTPSVILQSVDLLEANVLRATDAIHVAGALECTADLFVTSDRRQLAAAENAGVPSRFVGKIDNDIHKKTERTS